MLINLIRGTKVCCICKVPKLLAEFYKDKSEVSGLQYSCAKCSKAAALARYHKNPARSKKTNEAARHRLRDEVLRLLGGKCVRCGFDDPRALQVDHIEGGGGQEHKLINSSYTFNKRIVDNPERRQKYQLLCANHNWIKKWENKEGVLRDRYAKG